MASFKADLLEDEDSDDIRRFILSQVIAGTEYIPQRFYSSKVLYSEDSEVQRGALKITSTFAIDSVCKLVRGNLSRLKREAKLYTDPKHLLNLQGRHVPRFFGYYECEYDDELEGCKVAMGCMFLEYCGEVMPEETWYDKKMKQRILNVMCAIHLDAHLEHGDFELGNVVMRGSAATKDLDIRIIDFNLAFEHHCERKMYFDWWSWEPHIARFGCEEMFYMGIMFGVWTPAILQFLGSHYNIFRVATVERLVKSAVRNNSVLSREYIEPRAKAALAAYFEMYSERFALIGDPRDHLLPLLEPGVTENPGTQVPLPAPRWKIVDDQ